MNKYLSVTQSGYFAQWQAYYELCKPRVVALMLVTAIVGMCLATPGMVPLNALLAGTLGIALISGSAAVINHVVDQRVDAIMSRTKRRPLPTGRVSSKQAIYFAAIIAALGTAVLLIWVNALTAILSIISLIGYAGIYTGYLKRATSQNIVIGGLAGAAPPLLGWTAVTNAIDPQSLLLVLIIFVWTPPHFWALAIARYEEYAKVDIPMLPVTHGIAYTQWSIFFYTLLLLVVSLLPFLTGMSGLIYAVGALFLSLGFIALAAWLLKTANTWVAMQTFAYSIYYLFLLFIMLLVDHYVR